MKTVRRICAQSYQKQKVQVKSHDNGRVSSGGRERAGVECGAQRKLAKDGRHLFLKPPLGLQGFKSREKQMCELPGLWQRLQLNAERL